MTLMVAMTLPFLLLTLSLTRFRLAALALLILYSATVIFLLARTGLTTISSTVGLGAAIALLIYSSFNCAIDIFLLSEGRERRKGKFEELLGRYDR